MRGIADIALLVVAWVILALLLVTMPIWLPGGWVVNKIRSMARGSRREVWLWGVSVLALILLFGWTLFPSPNFAGATPSASNIWIVGVDNRWFLDFIRIVVAFVGVFVILSIVMRARGGDWIKSFGPFDTEEAKTEADQIQQNKQSMDERVDTLVSNWADAEKRAAAAISDLATMREAYAALLAEREHL